MIVVAAPSAHRGRRLSHVLKAAGVVVLCERRRGGGQLATVRCVWKMGL